MPKIYNMPEISKKRVITAGLIGGIIFSIVVTLFDHFFGKEFSWTRPVFYFIFGFVMYSFLTYRNFKKHNKRHE
ncbi:hypothetical protein [Psychroserpens sp. Hel_I_66]|uniref:hypothetical protein n=1 Tax=Psychroserpens sp. Hel_I_66 TaxID=1250004 RepID=UPI0012E09473|nr:hypothetical protein [Psychroserpens sp. Hel_I_66]